MHAQSSDSETSYTFDESKQEIKEIDISILQEQNASLEKEVIQLRAQFAAAVKLTESMDSLHNKNKELSTQLREVTTERDELQQRLLMTLRTIDDLNSKIDSDKTSSYNQTLVTSNLAKDELKKNQLNNKEQIDALCNQLETLQSTQEKNVIQIKLMTSKEEKLMRNANRFFNSTFQGIDQLTEMLASSTKKQQFNNINTSFGKANSKEIIKPNGKKPSNPTENIICHENTSEKYSKESKTCRALQKSVEARAELEKQLSNLQNQQKALEIDHQNQIKALEQKSIEEREDFNLLQDELKHKITVLENKVESLKNDLAKAKAKYQAPSQPFSQTPQAQQGIRTFQSNLDTQASPQVPILDISDSFKQQKKQRQELTKVAELEMMNDSLRERNIDLSSQVRDFRERNNELTDKFQNLEESKKQIDLDCDKLKNDLNSLQIVHSHTLEELKTMREALHVRKPEEEKKKNHKLKVQMKAAIKNLTKSLEVSKKQIGEQQAEIEEHKTTIRQTNKQIQELKENIRLTEQKVDDLENEKEELARRLSKKPTLTAEDIIPTYSLRYPEFGAQLCSALDSIVANQCLSHQMKLQNIYQTIKKFYVAELQKRDGALDEAYSDNLAIHEAFNHFLIDLTILLGMEPPVTFEDFFANNKDAAIMNAVRNLIQSEDQLKVSLALSQTLLNKVVQITEYNGDLNEQPFLNFIQQKVETIQEQKSKLTKLARKVKKLQAEISCRISESKKDSESSASIQSQLLEEKEHLTRDKEQLTSDLSKLRKELQQNKLEFQDMEEENKETIEKLSENYENRIREIKLTSERNEAELRQKLQQAIEHGEAISDTLGESEAAIIRLKKTIQVQKTTIAEKSAENEKIKEDASRTEESLRSKNECEKAQLIQSYEKAVTDITAQCEAHRKDLEKLSAELCETQSQVKKLKKVNYEEKKKALKAQNDFKQKIEEMKRDQQLKEAQAHAEILEVESKEERKIGDLECKQENEKRKIFSYFADQFNEFFTGHSGLNESTYHALVLKTREEMDKLKKGDGAIRRMLNIPKNQALEEAVAQALMHQND